MSKKQFAASPYQTAVLSKSTIVPSDHQQLYRDGETMRFEVPAFMSYIDPRQSYLKCRIRVDDAAATNHIRLKLDPSVGGQGLIDRIRIYDGNNQVQLENLENYAERIALTNKYSQNQSILAKRELLEGVETSEDFLNGQFFNAYTANQAVGASVTMNDQSLEVAMPIHSGILGGDKLFPVELFDGLRIEVDLNRAGKFLRAFNTDGLATDVGGKPFANGIAVTNAVPSAVIKLFGTEVALDAGQTPTFEMTSCSNVKVGDTISGIVADGTTAVLGVVASLAIVGGGGGFAGDHTEITLTAPYTPIVGGTKDLPIWLIGTPLLGDVFVTSAVYNTAIPRVLIDKVELVLKQVTPPAGLINQYAKAVQTEAGASIDIMTFETYRNNIQADESVSQVQIPSYNSRAKSVLCLPVNNEQAQNLTTANLSTTLDNIQEYQFYINGQPQPTRSVRVADLSKTIPTANQIALWELQKSLSTSGVQVRDLEKPETAFAIGRALARYNGVYNLKEVGGLALKQEYSGSAVNKLLITYVGSLRRLTINSSGKVVEL